MRDNDTGAISFFMAFLICLAVVGIFAMLRPSFAESSPQVPKCAEDEVLDYQVQCIHPDNADFRDGRWYPEN